jgi:hypothetical protein
MGHARLVALAPEEQSQQLGRIVIIVDDQHPPNFG